MSRLALAALLASAMLVAPANALAFCRTRTCESDLNVSCEPMDGCSTVGPAIWWQSACLRYAVQRNGSPKLGVDVSRIHALIEEAFGRWSAAACDSSLTPAFLVQSQGNVACEHVEFNCDAREHNLNVVAFVDQEWAHSAREIALTTLSINVETGEILDADIELNSERYEFVVDPPAGSTATNLQMVLAHEIGHFLGLSHSNDTSALMREGGTPTADLKPDDVAGVCAIFPHSATDPACTAPRSAEGAQCLGNDLVCSATEENGCGCSVVRGRSGFAALAACALALSVARFRRRRRAR